MSYSGYDIEDAIIMNKASLDRGFGRCVVLRKYGAVLKKHQNRSSDLLAPPSIPPGQASLLICSVWSAAHAIQLSTSRVLKVAVLRSTDAGCAGAYDETGFTVKMER